MTALAASGLVLAGLGLAGAPSASAATTYSYVSVSETQACKWQYGGPQYVAIDAFGGAYGWACYSVSFGIPLAVSANPVGGIDMNAYCRRIDYRSWAVLLYNHPLGWYCKIPRTQGGW